MAILSWNHGHTENFRALISVEFYILINKRLEFMNFIEDSFNQHQCCLLLFFCSSTKSYQKSGTDASIPRFCSFLPTVIPEEPKIKTFFTDDWGAYERLLPESKHIVGKANTQGIERENLNFRTRIKRLARKTICFSRSEAIHDKVIGELIDREHFQRF